MSYRSPSDLELVFHEKWTNPRCGVETISPGENGAVVLTMKQPGWRAVNNKGGTSVTIPAYYENALELLDEEGEWYLDTREGYLYYKPRFFEDINTAEFTMPALEKLMTLEGISAADPITNIVFRGIEFAYTTWLRPSTGNGLCDAQNNHLRDEGDRLPEAAVEVKNAHGIVFENCTFDRLGITALKLTKAIQNCTVEGNEFYEISGSAVSLGDPNGDYQTIVNPAREKDFITGNRIANNYIHHVAVEYQSAAAISAGFPKDTEIVHNEIYDAAYSSMHIGYGWDTYAETGTGTQNLHITNNYIHNVMNDKIFDGGGIYTIGATGGTIGNPNLICENYLKDVKNYYGVLYTDEGSSFWRLSQNVIDQSQTPYWYGAGNNKGPAKWLHAWVNTVRNCQYVDNYSTTAAKTYAAAESMFEEPHLYPDATWPEAALDIIARSGIEPMYERNFTYGLQEITADSVAVTAGGTETIRLRALTRKDAPYELSGAAVYTRSRNPEIAAADGLKLTAVQPGQTVVDVAVIEQNICRMLQVEINVE